MLLAICVLLLLLLLLIFSNNNGINIIDKQLIVKRFPLRTKRIELDDIRKINLIIYEPPIDPYPNIIPPVTFELSLKNGSKFVLFDNFWKVLIRTVKPFSPIVSRQLLKDIISNRNIVLDEYVQEYLKTGKIGNFEENKIRQIKFRLVIIISIIVFFFLFLTFGYFLLIK